MSCTLLTGHLAGTLLVILSLVVSALCPIEKVFKTYNVYGGPTEENRLKVFKIVRLYQWSSVILGAVGAILLL